ncbi:MAG: SIMPL domain-containing protein [Woeseiaceae bacterium]
MKRLILLTTILAVAGVVHAETELKGSPEELRQFLHPVEHTVTLTGTHEETAYSDKAIVSLVITTEADRLSDSMESNTRLRTSIAQSTIDAGVSPDEINTSKFSSSPQFGWFGGRPKSFEVVNRMSVGITDEAHLQLIARLTDDNDEIVMAGMEFEHTAKEEFQANVRKAALDKALAQRTAYEQQLGIKLTPINVQENVIMPNKAPNYIEEISVSAVRQRGAANSAIPASAPPPQTFDEVSYQATVYVTFEVQQQ